VATFIPNIEQSGSNVEFLPSKYAALNSNPSTEKKGGGWTGKCLLGFYLAGADLGSLHKLSFNFHSNPMKYSIIIKQIQSNLPRDHSQK
jgi:hypothetical protein